MPKEVVMIGLEEFINTLEVKHNTDHYAYISFKHLFINDSDAHKIKDMLKEWLLLQTKGLT